MQAARIPRCPKGQCHATPRTNPWDGAHPRWCAATSTLGERTSGVETASDGAAVNAEGLWPRSSLDVGHGRSASNDRPCRRVLAVACVNAALWVAVNWLLIGDSRRFEGVTTIGVDGHGPCHTKRCDKLLTVAIGLPALRTGNEPSQVWASSRGASSKSSGPGTLDVPGLARQGQAAGDE